MKPYFLAQGTAPYQLVINDPETLKQPAILLSDHKLAAWVIPLMVKWRALIYWKTQRPDLAQYKKWGLWAVLSLIVLILSLIAYRLYQQTNYQTNHRISDNNPNFYHGLFACHHLP